MEFIHVTMIRETLAGLPRYPCPSGYKFHLYEDGDVRHWADIETSAGEFESIDKARAHFLKEFGPFQEEMARRCVFLTTDEGRYAGTATAWYNSDFRDGEFGRIHWVGIHRDFQGKGLGKPLMSEAMDVLGRYHSRAYLTTQTTSAIAIKIYLDFGFAPLFVRESCARAWRLLAAELRHPALEKYRAPGI